MIGYRFTEGAKISATTLAPHKGESPEQFRVRCQKNGYEYRDNRNIVDHYKHMSDIMIRGDLNSRRHNFSVLCVNLVNDFNLSSIIRANNAFCGQEVFIFGRKKYDTRGSVGTHLYENLTHVAEVDDAVQVIEQFDHVVGIDNVDGAVPINDIQWDYKIKTLLIVGQESIGIPSEILDICDQIAYIKQFGSVRSLNVSQAASIAMHEYCRNLI